MRRAIERGQVLSFALSNKRLSFALAHAMAFTCGQSGGK